MVPENSADGYPTTAAVIDDPNRVILATVSNSNWLQFSAVPDAPLAFQRHGDSGKRQSGAGGSLRTTRRYLDMGKRRVGPAKPE